jgi:hypothetical protein
MLLSFSKGCCCLFNGGVNSVPEAALSKRLLLAQAMKNADIVLSYAYLRMGSANTPSESCLNTDVRKMSSRNAYGGHRFDSS